MTFNDICTEGYPEATFLEGVFQGFCGSYPNFNPENVYWYM